MKPLLDSAVMYCGIQLCPQQCAAELRKSFALLPKKIDKAVIGIGNTLRRDDGIGILVLESLLDFYKREDIDYLDCGSAGFDLLHKLNDYKAVLLIDGINANLSVGELKISELKDIESKLDNLVTSTHELNLKNILELSKSLGIKTRIYVAGIQVGDISFGEGLSLEMASKKEDIVKETAAFIDKTFQ